MATFWWPLTFLVSIAFSQSQVGEPGCSANYAYIYVESTLSTISKTITSERVNYAPYTYSQTVPRRKLVSFAGNELMTDTNNNPCDITTWSTPSSYYDNAIVILEYSSHFASICSPQQWTLNLQNYNTNIQALLISNNADLFNVYPLPGDESLASPTIPTRMISQSSAANILNITGKEDVFVSIDCFNTTSSPIICVVDDSLIGSDVELDGEFQKQADIFVNDHPVWLKEGMNRVWDDYYIWLAVDHSANTNAWKWVIGQNYNDDTSIIAECLAPDIYDPTECGPAWYRNGVPISRLRSTDGVCDLGDTYVCVDSGSLFFDYYFAGRYRQVHDATAVWLSDETLFDAFLSIKYVNMSFASGYSFVFSYAANGGVYAFCPISETQPSSELALTPWNCNANWYVVVHNAATDTYQWYNDPLMDVDECNHPLVSTSSPIPISYPKYLCFMDETYQYSLYQTYYGIYVLDNSSTYDHRFIYRNQRLTLNMDEWYILWYEEKDSFIINEQIPHLTFTSTFGAICRDNVDTPDQCSACWEFYQGLHDEINCNAKVKTILTNNEADCMAQPVNTIAPNYSDDVTLCFYSDANSDPLTHKYSGKWKLETRGYYNGRAYWYQQVANTITSYMYYDAIWRYWVIHSRFTANENEFDLRCLHWDEFEPFNCHEWYTADASIIRMDQACSVSPTISPTPRPTTQCIEYNKYVYVESVAFTSQILQSQEVNFAPYKSSTFFNVKLVMFEEMTQTTGNPCNSTTFAQSASYYDNSVVMMPYSPFYESLCSPQEWTLQLQNYANVIGVMVGNNRDFTHTYSLAGDSSLDAPVIPTRMISQMAGILLTYALRNQDDVFVSFGCFNDDISYPSTICLIDTTTVGTRVFLDGEYQRQNIIINDHPIWLKRGHEGLWRDIYMFLDVDSSSAGEASWKWVIGSDYNDRDSIIAVCDLNGQHIAHPALCDLDWSINGSLVSNISTKGTQCALGDDYVCVESTSGGFFETYFAGRYRQIHSGVALWLLESEYLDAHIRIASLSWPVMFGASSQYVFAFMVNQTDLYAFCVIGENYPSKADALAPYECNTDWYVISYDESNGYEWVIDLAFDIDECSHPNISTTQAVINYPSMLCLGSDSNEYSHFQGHYGVYVLDTTQTFDNRFVYKNQRLDGIIGNEWYMLWFEEKDAWIMNEMIPGETIVRAKDGICRQDVDTPDLCVNQCWEFYQGYEMEEMCDVKAMITSSNVESDCIGALPVNNIIHYTKEINLCFNDGRSSNDWDNTYSGKWYLEETATYGGRAYWYKTDNNDPSLPLGIHKEYYIFYDPYLRFWILDRILGTENGEDYLHYYCLHWDEFEPFNCNEWYSILSYKLNTLTMSSQDCFSSSPTQLPTPSPTISCDARKAWIYAETDEYVYAEETLTSMYTNFAPYVYTTFNKAELVIFENNREMEQHYSNPCDYYTWQEYPSYYENKVVVIQYNEFIASLCSAEVWSLNLERYANGQIKAVLIANDIDLNHVYPLSGISDPLSQRPDPTIPTRMISQFANIGIQGAIEQGEHVYITFGCFDDENGIDYPAIICLIDSSIMGKHVYLDGEYQRLSDMIRNEHPVWMKSGFEGVWKNIYMWLDIDQTVNGYSSWKWVIGTDYNRKHSIIAECLVHDDIDHPALCDGNWYIDDKLEGNITTSDTICELGDNYICVESAEGGFFDAYFDGQYRQIHSGVPLWFLEDSSLDAYITIGQITFPPLLLENEYAFAFALNQSQVFAFCPIGKEEPSREIALSPQDCNKNWYKLEILSSGYTWVIDYAFDIDECAYKLVDTPTPEYIEYPEILCLSDATNEYSRYQSHYGIYLLDKTQTYDEKYVYYNQRLAGNGNGNEWFMLWYDEKDAWVLNEMIPDITVVRDKEGICREEVFSPDLCSACWEFSDNVGNYESNCNVKVRAIDSAKESDCMTLPVNNMMANDYVSIIVLKFDDGTTDIDANVYSGIWRLSTQAKYGNRVYWFKYFASGITNIEYYMFYDESYRYWVIDRQLGSVDKMSWHLYCVNWYEYEPFNCDVWYTNSAGFSMKMDAIYQLPTTTTTTTSSDVINIDTTKTIADGDGDGEPIKDESSKFNILPWIVCSIGFIALCASLLVFYCRRKKKQRFMFQDVSKDGIFKTVYGVTYADNEAVDLNMIQMENVKYDATRGGTVGNATRTGTKGKGEIIAMKDDDEDYDDDVVSHHIIDYEGTDTGSSNNDKKPLHKNKNNTKKPKNWVKFEDNE